MIGVLSGFGGKVDLLPVLVQSLRVQVMYVGSREMFKAMNRAIAQAKLKPVIDRIFPFHGARAACHFLQKGMHGEKVGITIEL